MMAHPKAMWLYPVPSALVWHRRICRALLILIALFLGLIVYSLIPRIYDQEAYLNIPGQGRVRVDMQACPAGLTIDKRLHVVVGWRYRKPEAVCKAFAVPVIEAAQ